MKKVKPKIVVTLIVLAAFSFVSPTVYAGDLEPPAPPTSGTMKTLDEVEPRIPISHADIPKTINTRGSYYLTEDINAATTAITVAADDVTIDLSGFTIAGPDSGSYSGIYINGRSNVEIRNGTVRDFYYGIIEVNSSGQDHRIIDIRAVSNSRHGINLSGSSHLIKDCTASENGESATIDVSGIYAWSGSAVIGTRPSKTEMVLLATPAASILQETTL